MDFRFVVIIPTKNRRSLLERALGSVFSQQYPGYRVVVVNDGSSDGTREYLDALRDPRVSVIHFEKSRGVNAARNAALRTLREGEWAVPLDDDDLLLPNAFETIRRTLAELPESVQVVDFNAVFRKGEEEFVSGYRFKEGEEWYEPTYAQIMGASFAMKGDSRAVLKWTLFPRYLFSEDINGFEYEFWMRLARDGVQRRMFPQQTTLIDFHPGEHLSSVAARRDPGSFARANARIFRDHVVFYRSHSRLAKERAFAAFKVALRALDPLRAALFLWYYLRAAIRLQVLRAK